MITIATAECFTQGTVAQEIHAYSQGYGKNYHWRLPPDRFQLSLVAGLFIPTLTGVRRILEIEPLDPIDNLNDIKVYNQKQDLTMALMMAKAVKKLSSSDIGIGTTAGVGKGGIALVSDEFTLTGTTDVDADLRSSDTKNLMKRKQAGTSKTLQLLEVLITKTV